jgi:uncharacterized hydrophobic protein (TIGR00271 family)
VRRIEIEVPGGVGHRVVDAARHVQALDTRCWSAIDGDRRIDVVITHVPNDAVDALLRELQDLDEVRVAFLPMGTIVLQPPGHRLAGASMDVGTLGPFEVYLSGLQAIGSWHGYLAYAFTAGLVVWLGLYTSTMYLLVGAMLIAPFAGPAMNCAIATARGDWTLLWRSSLRYVAALVVTAATTAALSLVAAQDFATEAMKSIATISAAAIVLPLAAGAAGALHLVQGERSSLVSGAGAGVLVAASLAPPAGALGMSMVIGRWDLIPPSLLLLGLQLVGINVAGAATFRLFGMRTNIVRTRRGRGSVSLAASALSVLAVGALLWWQLGGSLPSLRGATLEQRARTEVLRALRADSIAVLDARATFERPEVGVSRALLIGLVVVHRDSLPHDSLRVRVREIAREAVRAVGGAVPSFVEVRVVE